MARSPGRPRRWWLVPLLVVEVLLHVAVVGGISAGRDARTSGSSDSTRTTAQVTRTSRSCRGGCVFESYGDYTVRGRTERDVLLQCCADRPLSGRVEVVLAAGSPRHPVLAGTDEHGPELLGVGAAVLLVAGNVALVVLRRRRRTSAV